MDAIRRTLPLRRVAMMAALAATLIPATQAEAATTKKKAKAPVITSVSPMKANVGDTLTIKGRNFRKGKARNSVGFKRDGAAVVFVKADISTVKMLTVKLPARLEKQMAAQSTTRLPTRFHLRVLTSRFGKAFTSSKLSPVIGPKPAKNADGTTPVTPGGANDPQAAEADCDNDGVVNSADADDDNDLLSDVLENTIGTNGCSADSDGDSIEDGYEYRSAVDLNDDEYRHPNTVLPYPGSRPYPNPLGTASDAATDFDGDGLTMADEYALWKYATPVLARTFEPVPGQAAATPLAYSDGMQYSVSEFCGHLTNGDPSFCGGSDDNRRVPALPAAGYAKYADFVQWASVSGYLTVRFHTNSAWYDHNGGRNDFDIRDTDLSGGPLSLSEVPSPTGFVSDTYRDEDADGLSNFDELHSRMLPKYWAGCYASETPYPLTYSGTDATNADTDGDGVRDGADDQDHDDIPNIMELSRFAASNYQYDETDDNVAGTTNGGGGTCTPDPDLDPLALRHASAYGQVNPFNPCLPDINSRTCSHVLELGAAKPAPFGGPHWWALQ